jgi:uncharacterized protein YndB with AHSA1/START domain
LTASNDLPPTTRSLELEVEVPGTPEQVWQAIATGPGITAWFSPAEVEERAGGRVGFDIGDGLDWGGVVTAWEPPRRFEYVEDWQSSEGGPTGQLASEWLVEARSGGTCVVRLVSTFTGSGDWDRELEGMRDGWETYFRVLRLYMMHFPGQRSATIMARAQVPGTEDEAWDALRAALGLADVAEGDRAAAGAPGVPPLAGIVERVGGAHHDELMLRLDAPAPGLALVFVFEWQNTVYANVLAHLYGDGAPAVAARHQPAWSTWMDERFPALPARHVPAAAERGAS